MTQAPIGQGPGDAGGLSVWRRIGAAVALLEGLLMIGNALAVMVVVGRDGVTGPEPVASPAGVIVEVALYVLFGIALMWMARGFLLGSPTVLTPFMLAQILGLTVTIPLALGGGAAGMAGALVVVACGCGLVAWARLVRHNLRSGAQ